MHCWGHQKLLPLHYKQTRGKLTTRSFRALAQGYYWTSTRHVLVHLHAGHCQANSAEGGSHRGSRRPAHGCHAGAHTEPTHPVRISRTSLQDLSAGEHLSP